MSAEPKNAQLVHLQGIAYAIRGQTAEAERNFRRAVELDPSDLAAYQSLAALMNATGRTDEMIKTYEKALETQPNSASLNLTVGSLYEAKGDAHEGDDLLRARPSSSIRISPRRRTTWPTCWPRTARTWTGPSTWPRRRRPQLPDNPNAADTLGWVLFRKGVPGAAIGYLKDAEAGTRADDGNLGLIRHHLAQAYEANNEPERAKEVLERALADLDAIKKRAADAGGQFPDPAWAADVRAMLDRLNQAAPPGAPPRASRGAPLPPRAGRRCGGISIAGARRSGPRVKRSRPAADEPRGRVRTASRSPRRRDSMRQSALALVCVCFAPISFTAQAEDASAPAAADGAPAESPAAASRGPGALDGPHGHESRPASRATSTRWRRARRCGTSPRPTSEPPGSGLRSGRTRAAPAATPRSAPATCSGSPRPRSAG